MAAEGDYWVATVKAGGSDEGYVGASDLKVRLADRVSELGPAIEAFSVELRETLASLAVRRSDDAWMVEEVKLSVSVDFEAEAGVIFARASTTAGMELQLTWTRSSSEA